MQLVAPKIEVFAPRLADGIWTGSGTIQFGDSDRIWLTAKVSNAAVRALSDSLVRGGTILRDYLGAIGADPGNLDAVLAGLEQVATKIPDAVKAAKQAGVQIPPSIDSILSGIPGAASILSHLPFKLPGIGADPWYGPHYAVNRFAVETPADRWGYAAEYPHSIVRDAHVFPVPDSNTQPLGLLSAGIPIRVHERVPGFAKVSFIHPKWGDGMGWIREHDIGPEAVAVGCAPPATLATMVGADHADRIHRDIAHSVVSTAVVKQGLDVSEQVPHVGTAVRMARAAAGLADGIHRRQPQAVEIHSRVVAAAMGGNPQAAALLKQINHAHRAMNYLRASESGDRASRAELMRLQEDARRGVPDAVHMQYMVEGARDVMSPDYRIADVVPTPQAPRVNPNVELFQAEEAWRTLGGPRWRRPEPRTQEWLRVQLENAAAQRVAPTVVEEVVRGYQPRPRRRFVEEVVQRPRVVEEVVQRPRVVEEVVRRPQGQGGNPWAREARPFDPYGGGRIPGTVSGGDYAYHREGWFFDPFTGTHAPFEHHHPAFQRVIVERGLQPEIVERPEVVERVPEFVERRHTGDPWAREGRPFDPFVGAERPGHAPHHPTSGGHHPSHGGPHHTHPQHSGRDQHAPGPQKYNPPRSMQVVKPATMYDRPGGRVVKTLQVGYPILVHEVTGDHNWVSVSHGGHQGWLHNEGQIGADHYRGGEGRGGGGRGGYEARRGEHEHNEWRHHHQHHLRGGPHFEPPHSMSVTGVTNVYDHPNGANISTIQAGQPIFVYGVSSDGAWALVSQQSNGSIRGFIRNQGMVAG